MIYYLYRFWCKTNQECAVIHIEARLSQETFNALSPGLRTALGSKFVSLVRASNQLFSFVRFSFRWDPFVEGIQEDLICVIITFTCVTSDQVDTINRMETPWEDSILEHLSTRIGLPEGGYSVETVIQRGTMSGIQK